MLSDPFSAKTNLLFYGRVDREEENYDTDLNRLKDFRYLSKAAKLKDLFIYLF